jgi:uncharacterized membrane protein
MEADETRGGRRAAALEPPWSQRGTDLSRLLALSDGIFAFAMTLLVLGIVLPAGFHPGAVRNVLVGLQNSFLAYALSFFVIWFYWLAHNQVFSYIQGYDRRLQQLNVIFLAFIAIMPFVTNLLAAASSQFLTVALYAGIQIAAGGTLTLLWVYATHHRRFVSSTLPSAWVEYVTLRSATGPLVFAASVGIALVNPVWGEYSWVSLFVLHGLVQYAHPRWRGASASPT